MPLFVMLSKLLGWLRAKVLPQVDTLDQQTWLASRRLRTNIRSIQTETQIEQLRLDLAADRPRCAQLGQALHENGLEGFAQLVPKIAQEYGYNFTSQDFKSYLQDKQGRQQAAYLVKYCRGGGIH